MKNEKNCLTLVPKYEWDNSQKSVEIFTLKIDIHFEMSHLNNRKKHETQYHRSKFYFYDTGRLGLTLGM